MDVNKYQKEAARTIINFDNDLGKLNNSEDILRKHLYNAASGMSIESNEVLQLIQRYSFCDKGLNKDEIFEECGDVLWYVSYLLTMIGMTLEDCIKCNLIKVAKRYPERFNN